LRLDSRRDEPQEGIVQFVGVARFGMSLGHDPRDRAAVEGTQVPLVLGKRSSQR
jgi:hypothetical protein